MNIINILWEMGYNIKEINNGVYTVQFSYERMKKMGKQTDHDLFDMYKIYVYEVGFNGFGNLYVEFRDINKRDEIFDLYEYVYMDGSTTK